MTGKYAWDMTPFYHELEEELNQIRIPMALNMSNSKSTYKVNESTSSSLDSGKGMDPLENVLLE